MYSSKRLDDPVAARTKEEMILANNIGNDCPICARPITSERWGVATTCGHPDHLGCYHLSCWERVAANHAPEGRGYPSCNLCNGAASGFVPVFVDIGHGSCDGHERNEAASKNRISIAPTERSNNDGYARNKNASKNSNSVKATSSKKNTDVMTYQNRVDHLGIRMGEYLEKMETTVDLFLDRVLVGDIYEIVFGAFLIGCFLSVLIINMDEMLFPSDTLTKLLPSMIRGLWLCVIPLVLPDIIRTLGEIFGVKEPMKSSMAIIMSCALAITLWLVLCDMVFLSILFDMAGDTFE